ncbi:MAG: tRNA (uridine(34)/cytosine(34)/5-carboxymethylaminomethyluridine(34)-2'-O)-methyltransferase TrmL [Ruminococcaceae bacterium]|nr:tRNA (uridine(34)/cytosine(34)/5-carboxymethylaminomethyluridine(34)-2'-O)-methyltransferase TrmL [Oscillospiraceae bacterium]
MNSINIVLHEPEIPQNTGNIARTCAATGASLHLIKPMGFTVDDRKLKRAGLDYWHSLDITYYENLDDFFERNPLCNFFCFTTKAEKTHCDVVYPSPVYLMFGKETAGLPVDFLTQNHERCVRIPMRNNQRSLNLSNSAAIAVYEVLRQWGFPGQKTDGDILRELRTSSPSD